MLIALFHLSTIECVHEYQGLTVVNTQCWLFVPSTFQLLKIRLCDIQRVIRRRFLLHNQVEILLRQLVTNSLFFSVYMEESHHSLSEQD